jgi:glycosyltransferase involved in cell wall biosynthesis
VKRLIFINRFFYPDISATSQILFDLTTRLAKEGYEVHVICSRQRYDDPNANLPANDSVDGVTVHRVRTTRFGRRYLKGRALDYASFYLTASAKLFALARSGDIVIAKTDPPLISIPAAIISKLRGAQLINWLQDVFPEVASQLGANPLPYWLDSILHGLRNWSLRRATTNVVLGTRMREYLETCGIPSSQLQIIENWADDKAIQPITPEQSALRTRLELQGKFVVAYSGNMGRAHDYETILGAAQRLVKERDIVFLMIGGGVKFEELRREADGRGFSNFVFLPYQAREALADSLAAADIHLACLIPSLEGLIVPSKFYGILAAGRPIIFIGDPDGELARVISKCDCGVAVRQGDADGLVSEIWRLSKDPEYWQWKAGNARAAFESGFTVEHGANKWLDVLVTSQRNHALPAPEPCADKVLLQARRTG